MRKIKAWLKWGPIGLRLTYWRDLATCYLTGHDPRRRVRFDGHGGVWTGVQCGRCGGWLR